MSDGDTPGGRARFRTAARPASAVPVQLTADGADTAVDATAYDLGMKGAFIVMAEPAPVGTRLTLRIAEPTAPAPIEVAAIVRWNRLAEGDVPAGAGVELADVDDATREALSALLATFVGPGVDGA
jgi:hypothetical protein